MQTEVTINCASGVTVATGNLFIQKGYYLNSVQLQNVHTIPLFVWVEYFYDRNESTKGEILDSWWIRNTAGYDYAPARIFNKKFDSELSKCVFHVLNQSGSDETAIFVCTYSKEISYQNNHYREEDHRGVWALDYQAQTTDVAGGSLILTITPAAGTWFKILSILIGPDDYTTDETIIVKIYDENDSPIKSIIHNSGTDNEILEGPGFPVLADDVTSAEGSSRGSLGMYDSYVAHPDKLRFITSALAQNETFTIRIRAKLKSAKPPGNRLFEKG